MMSLGLKRSLSVFCILIVFHSLWGQSSIEGQIKISREREFRGEALYGFMNGGSELFLEYGFNVLKALEVEFRGDKFSVEIYQMNSPEGAFGIYSQHTFKCNPADELFICDCSSPGQYQAAIQNIYISVVSETGSSGYRLSAKELAEFYINKFKSSGELLFPKFIAKGIENGEKISKVVKFAMGPIALSNSLSSYMFLFDNITPYRVWIVSNGGEVSTASVVFESADNRDLFLARCAKEAKEISVKEAMDEELTLILNFPSAFWE